MYPYERSLVAKMQGKPFALLGVNSDKDRAELRKSLVEEKITWRSWIDGGTSGPIDQKWGIRAWPSIFVIDHKGVIRYQDVHDEALLDNAVDVLLKEMEEKK